MSFEKAPNIMEQPFVMKPRYQSKGEPISPKEFELLVNLMEEAGEVVQRCAKILRFGKEDTNSSTGAANTYEFGIELGSLQAMIDLAVKTKSEDCFLVVNSDYEEGQRHKIQKLRHFSQYLP